MHSRGPETPAGLCQQLYEIPCRRLQEFRKQRELKPQGRVVIEI